MTVQQHQIAKNSTDNKDVIIELWIINTNTGRGITGIIFSDLVLRAWERGQAGGAVTAAPIAGTIDTYVSNGFVEVDATNLQGLYQYSIPNAALQVTNSEIDILFDINIANAEDVLVQITITSVPTWTGVQVSPDGWDALAIESLTAKQAIQLMAAVLCGQTTGAETSKTIFKAIDNPATQRLSSESDDETNRTLIEVFI